MDELRDRIARTLAHLDEDEPWWDASEADHEYRQNLEDQAQAVIDNLGLHHVEGKNGEWRYVSAWQETNRPF